MPECDGCTSFTFQIGFLTSFENLTPLFFPGVISSMNNVASAFSADVIFFFRQGNSSTFLSPKVLVVFLSHSDKIW